MSEQAVQICVGPGAGASVQRAAGQLRRYLRLLFGIEAAIEPDPSPDAHKFVLGVATDALINQTAGSLPALSDQGHLVRRVTPDTMVLAGGSDVATAWAVYELVERYGVRYLLHGDALPQDPGPFHLPPIDQTFEPLQPLRAWRQFSELSYGPIVWSLDGQKRFIDQLFKLKFNGVYVVVWPHHPVIDLQIKGIRRRTAHVLLGHKFVIDEDNIGRDKLWDDMPLLTNPELIGAETYEEQLAAGLRLVRGILEHARALGMHTTVGMQPLEFPVEFRPLLQKPSGPEQSGGLTAAETGDLTNPVHLELVEAVFDAYLQDLGQADLFEIHLPEHPQTASTYRDCWRQLVGKFGLEPDFSIDEMLAEAQHNGLVPGGLERAEREFKSAVSQLHFFDYLFHHSNLLDHAAAHDVELSYAIWGGDPLMGLLHRVLPPQVGVTASMDYTASRTARRLHDMQAVDAGRIKAMLIITLQDDNIGWVPQVATSAIDVVLRSTQQFGWHGFFTRYWPIGDLDPTTAYLARASWDRSVTPQSAYDDHFSHVYGPTAAPILCRAMRLLEDATIILDLDHLGLLFPVQDQMKGHVSNAPATDRLVGDLPASLHHVRAAFDQVRRLLEALRLEPGPPARRTELEYWISRCVFAISAITEIELLTRGSRALCGDGRVAPRGRDEAKRIFDQAIAQARIGLQAAADNVRDDSDRGALAAYHHLLVRQVEQRVDEVLRDPG